MLCAFYAERRHLLWHYSIMQCCHQVVVHGVISLDADKLTRFVQPNFQLVMICRYTVLFAVARTVGWVAQWKEMAEEPISKISRPRQVKALGSTMDPCLITFQWLTQCWTASSCCVAQHLHFEELV